MGFFNELESILNLDELEQKFKLSIINADVVAVEGILRVNGFSSDKICFVLRGGQTCTLSGIKLAIEKLEAGEAIIKGKVQNIEFTR